MKQNNYQFSSLNKNIDEVKYVSGNTVHYTDLLLVDLNNVHKNRMKVVIDKSQSELTVPIDMGRGEDIIHVIGKNKVVMKIYEDLIKKIPNETSGNSTLEFTKTIIDKSLL